MAWEAVAIEDEHLRLVALPAKGGEISSLVHRPTGVELLARLRPLPPDDGTLHQLGPGSDEASFNRWYAGGWQELLPNGDAPCEIDGIAHSFHGDAWHAPWTTRRLGPRALAMEVVLDHARLRLQRTVELAGGAVVIAERLANEGDRPLPILWGHHPAFGAPLAGPGSRIIAPPASMETVRCGARSRYPDRTGLAWPAASRADGSTDDVSAVLGPDARTHDLCLLRDLPEGRLGLENPGVGLRATLRFDPALFRWAWIWMLHGGEDEPPFDGHCVALEPWTGPPGLPRAIAEDAALVLEPDRPVETEVRLEIERL
jgi:galactose mutarotase-like enzyme